MSLHNFPESWSLYSLHFLIDVVRSQSDLLSIDLENAQNNRGRKRHKPPVWHQFNSSEPNWDVLLSAVFLPWKHGRPQTGCWDSCLLADSSSAWDSQACWCSESSPWSCVCPIIARREAGGEMIQNEETKTLYVRDVCILSRVSCDMFCPLEGIPTLPKKKHLDHQQVMAVLLSKN